MACMYFDCDGAPDRDHVLSPALFPALLNVHSSSLRVQHQRNTALFLPVKFSPAIHASFSQIKGKFLSHSIQKVSQVSANYACRQLESHSVVGSRPKQNVDWNWRFLRASKAHGESTKHLHFGTCRSRYARRLGLFSPLQGKPL